ncbi:hypothetical protein [Enterococcus sp. SMC-9]|uniref:hypothetical protein n=1 Tax=Enterococcus sp. SMC-9 TaxID=2862343 RepID=UPI001E4534B6|nr:hypothetical protein [Enterococcus sp. SMC-9]MCD1024604.1 hypothetical protein [Enterococcus sp. SMC-9]
MKQTKTSKEKQCKTFTPRNEFEARLFKRFENYVAAENTNKNNTVSIKQERQK